MGEKEIGAEIAVLADKAFEKTSESLMLAVLRAAPLYGDIRFIGDKEAIRKQVAGPFAQELRDLVHLTDPRELNPPAGNLFPERHLVDIFVDVETKDSEANLMIELITDFGMLLRAYKLVNIHANQLANGADVKDALRAEINTLVSCFDAAALSIKAAIKRMATAMRPSDFQGFSTENNISKIVALKNKLFS
jgi:hypothetical protein